MAATPWEEGVVSDWREEGGYGFLSMLDGRRAYVHRSHFGGAGSLSVGTSVQVITQQDPRNPQKWAVQEFNLEFLETTPGQEHSADTLGDLGAPAELHHRAVQRFDENDGEEGVVTEWRKDKGFGFVTMEDGRKAYIHRTTFGGLGDLDVGSAMQVTLQADPRNPGKVCVAEVLSGTATVAPVTVAPVRVAPPAASRGLHRAVSRPAAQSQGEGGCVSDWNDAGGYGFVMMDDGRRAYVHRSAFGGEGSLTVGSRLRVTTKPDPRNAGKWSVETVLGDDLNPQAPAATPWTGNAVPPPRRDAGHVMAVPQNPNVESGVVSDWNETGGYGFLTMDDGRRAYIHRSVFGGSGSLTLGERLHVSTQPDPRNAGKWSVAEIVNDVASAQPAWGQTYHVEMSKTGEVGTVSDWNEQGGFGFVEMTDGRRAYIHRSAFGGIGSLDVGMELEVTTKPDDRNPDKWCVSSVVAQKQQTSTHARTPHTVQAPSAAPRFVQPPSSQPRVVRPPPSAQAAFAEDGVVASWNEDGGYGFLEMGDGRKAYIHRTIFGGLDRTANLAVGTSLSVVVKPDERNPGKWSVGEVIGEKNALGELDTSVVQGEEGTVKEWNEAGGFGFMGMTDGRRVYIHRTSFGGDGSLEVGMQLGLKLRPDSKNPGKWCVDEVLSGLPDEQLRAKRQRLS